MSTIYCSACGTEMNNQATACPKCGKPTNTTSSRKVSIGLIIGIIFLPMIFVWFLLRKGYSTFSRVAGFIWLAVSVIPVLTSQSDSNISEPQPAISTSTSNTKPADSKPANSKPAEHLESYSIQRIAKAYEENTVSADRTFKNKRFIVTGVISAISTDLFGTAYVTMRGGVNEFLEPQLKFNDNYEDYVAKLKKGMKITLVCTGDGDIAKAPILKECAPQN
ncbi:OB-fold protein [Zymobacter palmae]|uniref:OB-fold protein n=1 Tax=Zymobacter palmae TaxID=33074 RepID=UPI00048565C2|nr:hypothetical protein [Zymobacter palmae]